MGSSGKTYVLLILSIVWALFIFYFCTMPPDKIPGLRIPHMDKMVHFVFFFVQSALCSLLFNFRTRKSYLQIILLSTLLAFMYGGLIEILQSRFFNRTGDLYDLMADILGGFTGAIIYPAVLRIYGSISKTYKWRRFRGDGLKRRAGVCFFRPKGPFPHTRLLPGSIQSRSSSGVAHTSGKNQRGQTGRCLIPCHIACRYLSSFSMYPGFSCSRQKSLPGICFHRWGLARKWNGGMAYIPAFLYDYRRW